MGLALTALVAYYTAASPSLTRLIFGNQLVFFALIIGELGLVIALSAAIDRLAPKTATMMFFVYAGLNGLTLSVIFLAYTRASIANTFFVTAGTFGITSLYGYTTKRDLTSWGSFFFMGLMGIILASLVNFFLQSEAVYWVITYIGVFVFVGLTAYDTQAIKNMAAAGLRRCRQRKQGRGHRRLAALPGFHQPLPDAAADHGSAGLISCRKPAAQVNK